MEVIPKWSRLFRKILHNSRKQLVLNQWVETFLVIIYPNPLTV